MGSTFAHRSPHSDRSHTIAHSRTLTRECKRACACVRAGMHVRGHTQTYTQTPSASPLRHGAHALSLCPPLARVPRRSHARAHTHACTRAHTHACTHARTRMHARTHAHTSAYSRRVVIGRMDVGVGEYAISGKQISDIAPVANASRSAQHSAWRVTFALAHSECACTCAPVFFERIQRRGGSERRAARSAARAAQEPRCGRDVRPGQRQVDPGVHNERHCRTGATAVSARHAVARARACVPECFQCRPNKLAGSWRE